MRLIPLLPATLAAAAAFSTAYADTLPAGMYSLVAHTTTTTIHASPDQGTLTGTLTFAADSNLTFANLIFHDTTDGMSFSFTVPGLTTYTPAAHTLSANIYNASDPAIQYAFSISTLAGSGIFPLTCGVDCDTDAQIPSSDGRQLLNEELTGTITPVPEPSALALVGTGLLAGVGILRRRITAM